jgi:hypothetical protein
MLFTTGATYMFFMLDSQYQLQSAAKNSIQRDLVRISESLDVQTLKLADGDLGVNITNDGGIPVRVNDIFVLDSDGLLLQDLGEPTIPLTLNPAELIPSMIDTNVTVENEATYTVRVVTDRGSIISAPYPSFILRAQSAISSDIAKAFGSISMDTTTLEYSQDSGETWDGGWMVPGGENTIWRINVTNLSDKDIYLANYSSFYFLRIVSGGGGQINPVTFYLVTNATAYTYPQLEDPEFMSKGGIYLPAGGNNTRSLYLKIDRAGAGFDEQLATGANYLVTLELFGRYNSLDSDDYFGQSLPFVGVRTP